MSDDSAYVTIAEAAKRLGVSENTVRRRVKAGKLEGYRQPRPQGDDVYLILASALPPAGEVPPSDDSKDVAPDAPSTADAIRAAVEPLENRLGVADTQLAAKDETIRQQAETIGRLQADAGHLTRQVTEWQERAADAEARSLRAEAELAKRRSWWKFWE